MQVTELNIPEVKVLEPVVHQDSRGYFLESYNQSCFDELIPEILFVQDNEAKSCRGVLRGLHLQRPPFAQSKLLRVIAGEILDVAVDVRQNSDTFGKHVSVILSAENKKQIFVPRGFAHGYVVLSDTAIVQYKVDNHYSKDHEVGFLYNDPELGIDWQVDPTEVLLSDKDKALPRFSEVTFIDEF